MEESLSPRAKQEPESTLPLGHIQPIADQRITGEVYAIGSEQIDRICFMYLGSRGVMSRFTGQLAEATTRIQNLQASFVVSNRGGLKPSLIAAGHRAVSVRTFSLTAPLGMPLRFIAAKRDILASLARERVHSVINLMPHLWTPLLAPAIRNKGVSYVTVIHDAVAHPGDPSGHLLPWLRSEARSADTVITLSQAVAKQLVELGFRDEKIFSLFHPAICYDTATDIKCRTGSTLIRLLLFGRIHRYKGLSILLEALELLRNRGQRIKLSVVGEGNLKAYSKRLTQLDARIINRWVDDVEIPPLCEQHDAIVLPYLECSQSGVAAMAMGHGLPVISTPTGGLVEQVTDGVNGIVARAATAASLADAINQFASDGSLRQRLRENIASVAQQRSFGVFSDRLVSLVNQRAPACPS